TARELLIKKRLIGDIGDQLAGLIAMRLQVIAADLDRARCGEEQARDHLDGGRLAGAVGAEEGKQLSRLQGQAERVHAQSRAVPLRDFVQLDHQGRRSSVRCSSSGLSFWRMTSCRRTRPSLWRTQVYPSRSLAWYWILMQI